MPNDVANDTKTLEELTESDAFSVKATVYDPIDDGVATVADDGTIDVGADHAGRDVGYVIDDPDDDQRDDEISAKVTVHDPIDAGFATVADGGTIDVGADHAGRRVGYVIEDRDDDQGDE